MPARALRRLIPAAIARRLRHLRGGRRDDDRLRHQLDALLASSDATGSVPTVFVLPTTVGSIHWSREHAGPAHWLVAERRHVAEACPPSRYLAECARCRARGSVPPSAFLFSDQFVEAPHAVILVDQEGRRRYLSAIDVVAHAAHGLAVHAWTGDAPAIVAAADGGDRIAPLLHAQATYLDACERLGEAWLARGAQPLRDEATRRDAAIQRIRRYESYLLQAFPDSSMDRDTRRILCGLAARRRGLRARSRVDAC